MKGETTKVAPGKNSEVKVCAAKIKPSEKELILGNGTVINIREHLAKYPNTKISLTLGKEEIKKGAQKAIKEYTDQNPSTQGYKNSAGARMEGESGDSR